VIAGSTSRISLGNPIPRWIGTTAIHSLFSVPQTGSKPWRAENVGRSCRHGTASMCMDTGVGDEESPGHRMLVGTKSGGRVHRAAARRRIACCSWRQGNRDPQHPRPGIYRASARPVSSSVVPRCITDATFRWRPTRAPGLWTSAHSGIRRAGSRLKDSIYASGSAYRARSTAAGRRRSCAQVSIARPQNSSPLSVRRSWGRPRSTANRSKIRVTRGAGL